MIDPKEIEMQVYADNGIHPDLAALLMKFNRMKNMYVTINDTNVIVEDNAGNSFLFGKQQKGKCSMPTTVFHRPIDGGTNVISMKQFLKALEKMLYK